MNVRDRVLELRRVPASQLKPSPKNWRLHPKEQADALRGLLAEVGFAGAALARELEDGRSAHPRSRSRCHCRGSGQAARHLRPHRRNGNGDAAKLEALLQEVSSSNDAVNALLASVAQDARITTAEEEPQSAGQDTIPAHFQILIEFEDEQTQAQWLEKLTTEGLTCRSLMS
jgi:hypothetical protein